MANPARLFKRFPRDFVELRKIELDRERNLHDMIEQSIGVVFPDLEVLDSEFERDGYRPDTVAFDKNRNTFVILEYKNRQDSKVLDQTSAYLMHMTLIFQMLGVADRAAHAVPPAFQRLAASKYTAAEPYGAWPAI